MVSRPSTEVEPSSNVEDYKNAVAAQRPGMMEKPRFA